MWLRVNDQPHRLWVKDPVVPAPRPPPLTSIRLHAGHPEGFLEAFANIYTAAYDEMIARASGQAFDAGRRLYPPVADGVDGMRFITQCVASAAEEGRWMPLPVPMGGG